MLNAEYRYLVSALLILLVGFVLGWWFKTPRQSLLLLRQPKTTHPEIRSLLELSTTSRPLVFLPTASRGRLIKQLIKHHSSVLCAHDPERYDIESPHLCISPLPNAQLVEQLALLQHIGPFLLLVDGLHCLEAADKNEDPFAPALDLLEDLQLPVLIFHDIAPEDERSSNNKNQTPPPQQTPLKT